MKKLMLAALTVLLIALVCCFILARRKQPLPALVTLPDGTSLRILGVTYGTNHVIGTKLARMTARLPVGLQDILKSVLGQGAVPVQTAITPTPELLVWLDHQTNRTGATTPGTGSYFTALLGDGSNFTSGPDVWMNSFVPWSQVEALHFSVFPRRDRQITLNIFNHDSSGGVRLCNRLSFANPLYRNYPQWQPESLPVTKRVGDLEVKLLGLETGHDNSSTATYGREGSVVFTHGTNRLDGQNHTAMELKLRPLVNTNEIWQVIGVDFSDATGNSGHNSGMSWGGGDYPAFVFEPGLWPGEAAWKLKLEIKRTEGFRPEEVFLFTHVPLGALNRTNVIAWATNVAGITVTLQSIYRLAPQTNNSWSSSQMSDVHFTLSTPAAGTQVDLLRMVCDTGKTNYSGSSGSSDNKRDYFFRDIPLAAQTADFTLAIQHSRTVEFTVKPQLPEVRAEAGK